MVWTRDDNENWKVHEVKEGYGICPNCKNISVQTIVYEWTGSGGMGSLKNKRKCYMPGCKYEEWIY